MKIQLKPKLASVNIGQICNDGEDNYYTEKIIMSEAARRNEKGLTPKQAELQELKVKVLELKAQGLSLRKISEELNITLGKVQRVLKK